MRYVSTRGTAPILGFQDVLLSGLARDGGLYLPESWPQFSNDEIRAMRGKSYGEIAQAIMWPFVEGEIERPVFEKIIEDAYGTFRHQAVCPLVQTGQNLFVLELFHGPTLAFKDVAMQLIGRLMDHVLEVRGERATVVGATSGDTGGAAIDAFAGRDRSSMFVLFPHGRVSPVQQRQMTTIAASNVKAIAIEGNFDDCQALVKAMFNDHQFRDGVGLAGVNSINWARIMAQIVYYFTSAISLGAPDRPVGFTVPTGNFGDIFAGFVAEQMGLPIAELIVATNDNDILDRTLKTGRYEMRGVVETTSPSMDIQVSSNFERLMFEAENRDAEPIVRAMESLKQSGAFNLSENARQSMARIFGSGRANVDETAATISRTLEKSGYLLDPHTAIGVHVAENLPASHHPMVVLGTAHPAKFPAAVEAATGQTPELPEWLGDLMDREETFDVLPNDLSEVQNYIKNRI